MGSSSEMNHTIAATAPRGRHNHILDDAEKGDTTVIFHRSRPSAAVVPAADLEAFRLFRRVMRDVGESLELSRDRRRRRERARRDRPRRDHLGRGLRIRTASDASASVVPQLRGIADSCARLNQRASVSLCRVVALDNFVYLLAKAALRLT